MDLTELGKVYDLELNANVGAFNNTATQNLYLFAMNNIGTVAAYASIKLYMFQIINNNEIVRNLVPCYRKLDGVIGMYDLVNDKFYTNLGTGTFLKGKDV